MAICLCGPAGCGKNTVGDILAKEYGYSLASFASELRKEVARVTLLRHPIPGDIRDNPKLADLAAALEYAQIQQLDPWAKPTHPVMRFVLQQWGTDYRRAQNENYWTDRAERGEHLAYTDTRFQNELSIGAESWYIWNPRAENTRMAHVSENAIKPEDCTRVVANDGSLAKLNDAVSSAFASHLYLRSRKRLAA